MTASEITNVEFAKIKNMASKESLYRSIAAEFGVSLDWIKNGGDNMYGADPRDEITAAFGELAARHDPVIDGFIQFLRGRTPEQLDMIAQTLKECVACIATAQEKAQVPRTKYENAPARVAASSYGELVDLSAADPDAPFPGDFNPGQDIP